MTQFCYTGQYLLKRAGRTSPNAFSQIKAHMPEPEVVLVSGRPAAGWTLETWRKVAATRAHKLQQDMLAAIDELEAEEAELTQKYKKPSTKR